MGATSGTVFVSQNTSAGYVGGVYKSTDYGATWMDSSDGLPCRYIFSVAADPSNPMIVWTGCTFSDIAHPGGIFRSSDAGVSWVPYGRGLRDPAIAWLSVDPADSGHVLAGGDEGIHEMHFAADTDQDGIPDSDENQFGAGDANNDGTQDSNQAFVASVSSAVPPFARVRNSGITSADDFVVVEIDNTAPKAGSCQSVSDLVVMPTDQIPLSNRMIQAAPAVRFILPDCQHATVKIRYSAVTGYPAGVFGSYSPAASGDAASIRWGLLESASAGESAGVWSLQLDQDAYGNVYAPGTGSILFQGAPGKDSIFGNGFD